MATDNGEPCVTAEGLPGTDTGGKISFAQRLRHITWAWYTLIMSTLGIALLLGVSPHRFNGLYTLGLIVFFFGLVLFTMVTIGMIFRFIMFKGTLLHSLTHPTESLFFPCFWLSIATILTNVNHYAVGHTGSWLITALRVLFWTYAAFAFLLGVIQYHLLFTAKCLTSTSMSPSWIMPIFPAMLVGTIAAGISSSQPPKQALPILVCGLTFQGLGFMVSVFMYSVYINRLITSGLPIPAMRPGMFIAVGPPSFTALAILGMSAGSYHVFPAYTTISDIADPAVIADIFRIVALIFAVFLWAVAFWFFCISAVATLDGLMTGKMNFHLSWYCFIFPNVGFTIALIDIGLAFGSQGILWVGSVLTALLVLMWIFVVAHHVKAVWNEHMLWPGKDEDYDNFMEYETLNCKTFTTAHVYSHQGHTHHNK